MSYSVTEESLANLNHYWTDSRYNLNWPSVFVSPGWLQVWLQAFGSGSELFLRGVWHEGEAIGIAPFLAKAKTVAFAGSADVCDYLDCIIAPGKEREFFNTLLDYLKGQQIECLDLNPVRHDSAVITRLADIARNRGYEVICTLEDVSLEMDLPPAWDGYLAILTAKQRHEVKRKLRRLSEAGNVEYRCFEAGQEVGDYTETFLNLFSLSREEKARFMTPHMESFFRSLAKALAEIGLLRFGIIEIDSRPAAMTMVFDYEDSYYLYNSAYDPRFNYLSAGLLCKVLCLKDSIMRGKKRWDFLKGGEPYKYQLGGREVPIYRCQINIK